jgi:hypothetical protein
MSFFTKEGLVWLGFVGLLIVRAFIVFPMAIDFALIVAAVLYTGWYLKRCYNEAMQKHPEAFLAAYSKMNGGK